MALPKRKKNKKKIVTMSKIPIHRFKTIKEPEPRFTRETINDHKRDYRRKKRTPLVGVWELQLQEDYKELVGRITHGMGKQLPLQLEPKQHVDRSSVRAYRALRKKIFKKRRLALRQWSKNSFWGLRFEFVGHHKIRRGFAKYSYSLGRTRLQQILDRNNRRYVHLWEGRRLWKLSKLLPIGDNWREEFKTMNKLTSKPIKNRKILRKVRIPKELDPKIKQLLVKSTEKGQIPTIPMTKISNYDEINDFCLNVNTKFIYPEPEPEEEKKKGWFNFNPIEWGKKTIAMFRSWSTGVNNESKPKLTPGEKFKASVVGFHTSTTIKINQRRHWYYVSRVKKRNLPLLKGRCTVSGLRAPLYKYYPEKKKV